MKRLFSFWAVLLLCGILCGTSFASGSYKITDLGAGRANDINDAGQVVGVSTDTAQAFLYDNGVKTSLGGTNSCATSINAKGQIVGSTLNDLSFLYADGTMTKITNCSAANSINSFGKIAGEYSSGAFLYSDGSLVSVSAIGKIGIGYGINEAGQVAGSYYGSDLVFHAFFYDGSTTHDIGTLGTDYVSSEASSINNSGVIVGHSTQADGYGSSWETYHAFIYEDGVMRDIGKSWKKSVASDINNVGTVVGTLDSSGIFDFEAFIYSHGVLTNLNTQIDADSGWTLTCANAINESGQIVGYGKLNGETHAYLLTPVPEPSAVAIVVMSALGFVWHVCRKRQ